MKTIALTTQVGPDRKMTVQLPPEIPPGEHNVVLVFSDPQSESKKPFDDWVVHDVGPWPANLDLSRESIYGDNGR